MEETDDAPQRCFLLCFLALCCSCGRRSRSLRAVLAAEKDRADRRDAADAARERHDNAEHCDHDRRRRSVTNVLRLRTLAVYRGVSQTCASSNTM